MSFKQKVGALGRQEKAYAEKMLKTANLYEKAGLYADRARYLVDQIVAQGSPHVHLDCGVASGHFLSALVDQLQASECPNYTLIGVDTNSALLKEAGNRLRASGNVNVLSHISAEYDNLPSGAVQRGYHFDPDIFFDKYNNWPQVILVQDDLRTCGVLNAILKRLGSQPLDSMSYMLPGLGENMPYEAVSYLKDVAREVLVEKGAQISRETRVGVRDLTKHLKPGQPLMEVWRLSSGVDDLSAAFSDNIAQFIQGRTDLMLSRAEISELPIAQIEEASSLRLIFPDSGDELTEFTNVHLATAVITRR